MERKGIMSIPKFHEFFPFVLEELNDEKPYPLKVIRNKLAISMNMTDEQLTILLPSKVQSVFDNRANWACYYLKRAGILETEKKGIYQLTSLGREYIDNNGFKITLADLDQYKSFRDFQNIDRSSPKDESEQSDKIDTSTPEDRINESIIKIHEQLSDELIEMIFEMSPHFFEKLVLDLLHVMGYGGKDRHNIVHTGYGPDGGVDGLIKEDALGIEHIYIQAKRWQIGSTVGSADIQKFAGALSGKGARKGIFITTTTFSKQALEFANNHQFSRIILIDGKQLTDLMITYGVGLYTELSYKIQKIDRGFVNTFPDTG